MKLDFPNEYLTSVEGYHGRVNAWGPLLIRSLTFKSNKKTYGPFGNQEGTSFSFPISGGKIVGFHGKSGWFLDSIGVHLIQQQNPAKPLVQTQSCVANATDNLGFSLIQGTIGQSYDIILAVRQKDDFSSVAPAQNHKLSDDFSSKASVRDIKLSRQSSNSSSDGESKEKVRNFNILCPFRSKFHEFNSVTEQDECDEYS